jgi:hypothetical protein
MFAESVCRMSRLSMHFLIVTVEYTGATLGQRRQAIDRLVPAGLQVSRQMLADGEARFRRPLPVAGCRHIDLQWSEDPHGCAIATFYLGKDMLSNGVFLSGNDPRYEAGLLTNWRRLMDKHAAAAAAAGKFQPAFASVEVVERPAVITVPWLTPPEQGEDVMTVAAATLYLAAAFFERVAAK